MCADETPAGVRPDVERDRAQALDARFRSRLALGCWAVVAIATVVAFTVPRLHVPRIAAGINPSPVTVPVGGELVQTFHVQAPGFRSVRVEILDAAAGVTTDFEVGVRQGTDIATIHRDTRTLPRWSSAVTLEFDPVRTDPLLVYALRVRPRGEDPEAYVTLNATEGFAYRDGALWLDRVELPLDLVMRVDATLAQPWRAMAALLRARIGREGTEWLVALVYLGSLFLILKAFARV